MTVGMIRPLVDRFEHFLNEPIRFGARVILALLVLPLALSFTQPLWRITLHAPQYPSGLYVDISSYKIEGGHGGHDVDEINELNHYIGMRRLERAAFEDLDWLPFAIGVLAILTLRTAVIGNVRTLIDLGVITGYISVFAFARFVYKLYTFGHDLDPHAALTIAPFMPAVIGTKQIANFSTQSMPQWGSIFMGIFAVGVGLVAVWHLIVGYRAAWRAPAAAVLAAAVAGGGCAVAAPGPASLEGLRASCAYCRMGVTEQRTASQMVAPGEEPRFFDDLGCLGGFLRDHPDLPAGARLYVADHRTSDWVPVERAIFARVPGLTAAMGSHVVAYDSILSRDQDPLARGATEIPRDAALRGGQPGS